MDDEIVVLRISRRDIGRLLVGVRERRKKLNRGLNKFRDSWDDELGKNLKDGEIAYANLEKVLNDAVNNPRGDGRHST